MILFCYNGAGKDNMPRLSIRLLGTPRLERDGQPVSVDTRKATALLAYVAVTKERYQRDALVLMLWPELDRSRGLTALRRTLYALRKATGDGFLEVDRESVGLDRSADIWLDVEQFQRHLNDCLAHGHAGSEVCSACITPLEAAVALYRGDFLAGFGLRDSLNFDDWQYFHSDTLRQDFAGALERLVRCYVAQGDIEAAIDSTRIWLELDRLNEDAHHCLIELYARSGRRNAALRQYQECVRLLKDELGAPPQPETTALYEAILEGRAPGAPTPAAQSGSQFPRAGDATRDTALSEGVVLQDRYRLDTELGRGGFSVVYRARDLLLERDVALKVLSAQGLDAEGRARLLGEARAAAGLNHPNIVTVYDVGGLGIDEGFGYVVLEMVDGESLHNRRSSSMNEVISVARQVCMALEQAHAHGIVHRDLKPENVLMTPEGTAKLMDFGLARSAASRVTAEGMIVGTVYYIAPEQALGGDLDGRADLYALGVMLYELTTGQLPFAGDDPLAVISQHLHTPALPPRMHNPEIPAGLDSLIVRLLSKKAKDRPASATDVLEMLERMDRPPEAARSDTPAMQIDSPLLREHKPVDVHRPLFVARDRELALLDGHLDAALAGRGRVVFVTGGAGRGKTSLMQEVARRAQERSAGLIVAGGNCNAHTGIGDPYLPFREILGLLTGDIDALWAAGAITRGHARRLWDALPETVKALTTVGPDLVDTFIPGAALARRGAAYAASGINRHPEWLSPLEELVARKAQMPPDPNLQQSALFEQYVRVMTAVAAEFPLLLTLDDLQWADVGSIGLLFHLGRSVAHGRIMMVCAYRAEEITLGRGGERHPLEPVIHELQRDYGDIVIDLAQAEERGFIDAYLDREPNHLSAGFREALFQRSRGHPLFTVELLRRMQERGDLVNDDAGFWVEGPTLDWATLPTRAEAVIAERIARLDPRSREALEIASVEGETFTAEVVAQVQSADEREMVGILSRELDRRHQLVRAQEVQRLGARRLSSYRFQHILFQNYLYDNLDPVERALLHDAVGTALEVLYEGHTGQMAVSLARHFEEAGSLEKALEYLRQAGDRAVRLSANEAAIDHFSRALKILETMPESLQRLQQELDLQIALGVPLVLTKGHAAPEVQDTYARARGLSGRLGETPQLFHVLLGLRRFYLHRGELLTARELGEQLIALARSLQHAEDVAPYHLSRAHMMHAETLYCLGEFAEVRDQCETGFGFYDPRQRDAHLSLYGNDTGIGLRIYESLALWHLGFPDRALRKGDEMLSLAQELAHPFTLVFALYFAGTLSQFCRQVQAARQKAEEVLRISEKQGFTLYAAWGTVLRGWALAEQGSEEVRRAQMQEGVAALQALGVTRMQPHSLALVARSYLKSGRVEKARDLLAAAWTLVDETGERTFEAEIHRLRGESLSMEDQPEAEACFQHALDVARHQRAKSWELRAAMSLSRLWHRQGTTVDARDLLQDVYDWFTEGFGTADLVEARVLLDETASATKVRRT
jgi:DNA-binding SARP family transcriptional activator/predicted ATPase